MKLNLPNGCDNSPKRKLIQDSCLSFVKGDYDAIYKDLTDDILWEIVGDRIMSGKQEIRVFLEANRIGHIEEVSIDYILTHGKFGAVGGKIVLAMEIIHFAEFYDFTSAGSKKICKIKSFNISGPKPQ